MTASDYQRQFRTSISSRYRTQSEQDPSPSRIPGLLEWPSGAHDSYLGENESLRAWRLDPNTGVLSFVGKGAEVASAALAASPKGIGGMPGGMLALSSNGASPNTGIVWGLAPIDGDPNHDSVAGIARADDATNLDPTPIDPQTPRLKLLWDSQRAGVAYTHSKFCAPVVADGKLFVPTYGGRVDMYLCSGRRYMPAGTEEKPQAFENSCNESLDTRPLGTGGLGYRARGLCLPGFAQLLAPCEDIGFGLVEARIDAGAFYCVAGSTAGYEIARIFLSFMSARNHEIDAHDQRVFKTRTPIQTTIATDIIIAFQNLATFFNRDWGIHKRKRNEAKRHKDLPRRKLRGARRTV